jgi:hypothetical protein
MSTLARVVVVSTNAETYADSCAALVNVFNPEKIEISFLEMEDEPKQPTRGEERSAFVSEIRERINEIARSHEAYRLCKSAQIVEGDAYNQRQLPILVSTADIIDVHGVPKDLSVALVAESIMGAGVPILVVKWIGKFTKGKRNRIGSSPYKYQDLCELPRAQKLRKSYRQRTHVIAGIGVAIFIIAILSILSQWYPALSIAEKMLTSVSVAAGFAGLWLAVTEENKIGLTRRSSRPSGR